MNPIYLKKLKTFLQHLPTEALKLEEEKWSSRPAPNKWSKKEILGHLIDSGRMNLQRFLEIKYSTTPYILQTYAQDELVRANDYQNIPTAEIVQLWKSVNQQIFRIFSNITSEELNKLIEIPYAGKSENLKFLMEDYVQHLEHHLLQILENLDFAKPKENRAISVEEAMQKLGGDTRFATVLEHGTMIVEIYQPIEKDFQQPHLQDELYVIISGSGNFFNENKTIPFQTGDVLFVPAGVEHRFEDFTEDFKTWVIFYGAIGGEA